MAHFAPSPLPQPICAWSEASRKFEIYLRPGVMGRLGTDSWVAFKRLPRRGLEIGGVLLGHTELREDSTTFWIDGFAAVKSEYRSGPSYVLSEADLGCLQDEVKKNGPASIGLFRSQTRSEQLEIHEADAALFARFFDPTEALFLMVGPVPGKVALFLRSNGNLRCVHEFLLVSMSSILNGGQNLRSEEAEPSPAAAPEIRSALTPVVRQLDAPKRVDKVASSDQAPDRPNAPPPLSSHEPQPEALEKKSIEPVETAPHVKASNGSGVKRGRWILAGTLGILLVTAALSVRAYSVRHSSAPARRALEYIQLGVDRDGSSLRVHWDRTSPALRDATRAVLRVQDGRIQVDRILTASELSTGSVGYEPTNSELTVRLDVYSNELRATGLVQVVNLPTDLVIATATPAETGAKPKARRAPDALTPVLTPVVSIEPVAPQPITKADETGAIVTPARQSDGAKQEIPAGPSKPPDRIETKPPFALDSPAPKVPEKPPDPRVASATERAIPISSVPVPYSGPSVSISSEPVFGSKLGRAVGKIPLLRRLKSHDNVEGPVPVYQAQPSLKLPNQQHVTQPVSVDVKVDVAESGKVTSAEIVDYGEPPNFSLANAALAAARQWTFQPARTEDLPVASQVILHFRFNP